MQTSATWLGDGERTTGAAYRALPSFGSPGRPSRCKGYTIQLHLTLRTDDIYCRELACLSSCLGEVQPVQVHRRQLQGPNSPSRDVRIHAPPPEVSRCRANLKEPRGSSVFSVNGFGEVRRDSSLPVRSCIGSETEARIVRMQDKTMAR